MEGERKGGREEKREGGKERGKRKKRKKEGRTRKEMEEIPGLPVIVSWSRLCLFPQLFLLFSRLLHTVLGCSLHVSMSESFFDFLILLAYIFWKFYRIWTIVSSGTILVPVAWNPSL